MKAAAVGFTCIDVYDDGRHYATGNGVDLLFNLMDLRDDVQGSVVTAVGDDEYGDLMRETCCQHGVDISHISVIPGGKTACVEMKMNGRDRVHHRTERGVIADYHLSGADMDFVREQDLIHTDLSWPVTDQIKDMRKKGAKIYFDFSKRAFHPDAEEICRNIDYGIFSFEGNSPEVEELLRRGCGLGAKILIATFGEQGSAAFDGTRMYWQDAVPCENLVNTCGAGDSFGSGFLHGLLSGKSIPDCMRLGAEQAAKIVSIFEPYPQTSSPRGSGCRENERK